MKRLVIAGLVLAGIGVAAGSATAAGGNHVAANAGTSVIYDSTPVGGLPGNIPSVGPEAYAFNSLGNKIQFAGASRKLKNVVVTLSSWACKQGHWNSNDCNTPGASTFAQPITLTIWNRDHTQQIAAATKTFDVPYRPSVSPECASTDRPGGWYQPATGKCFNGLATQVRFNFGGNINLPDTVIYDISYNTTHDGPNPTGEAAACFQTGNCPYDSLNIALSTGPSIGSDADPTTVWINGAASPLYDPDYKTPAVQFNAARLWKV
jgi:hypothetical protein